MKSFEQKNNRKNSQKTRPLNIHALITRFSFVLTLLSTKRFNMKFLETLIIFVCFKVSASQTISSACIMPDSIASARLTRLHHPCESNQNTEFAIETHENFYCIFYSSASISIFGAETKFEITIDGEWDYEQV